MFVGSAPLRGKIDRVSRWRHPLLDNRYLFVTEDLLIRMDDFASTLA
jgi:hypothetical protein